MLARVEYPIRSDIWSHVSLTHFYEHVCTICGSAYSIGPKSMEPVARSKVGPQHGRREPSVIDAHIPHQCLSHSPPCLVSTLTFWVHETVKTLPELTFLAWSSILLSLIGWEKQIDAKRESTV